MINLMTIFSLLQIHLGWHPQIILNLRLILGIDQTRLDWFQTNNRGEEGLEKKILSMLTLKAKKKLLVSNKGTSHMLGSHGMHD